jgi:hypothetical protein
LNEVCLVVGERVAGSAQSDFPGFPVGDVVEDRYPTGPAIVGLHGTG